MGFFFGAALLKECNESVVYRRRKCIVNSDDYVMVAENLFDPTILPCIVLVSMEINKRLYFCFYFYFCIFYFVLFNFFFSLVGVEIRLMLKL